MHVGKTGRAQLGERGQVLAPHLVRQFTGGGHDNDGLVCSAGQFNEMAEHGHVAASVFAATNKQKVALDMLPGFVMHDVPISFYL